MTPLTRLAAIGDFFAARGGDFYGEAVTQHDHAVQCAGLATARGAAPVLIAAALLHDIGHLLDPAADGGHASHAAAGAAALAGLFSQSVCGPVALHVAAKRYLCFADADYAARLSQASRLSLIAQGEAFTAAAAAAFIVQPFAADAVAVRRLNDAAKVDGIAVLGLPITCRCLPGWRTGRGSERLDDKKNAITVL